MVSERFQRRIDRILDQIEDAADRRDWPAVRQGALDLLVFDPANEDAKNFLADRWLAVAPHGAPRNVAGTSVEFAERNKMYRPVPVLVRSSMSLLCTASL